MQFRLFGASLLLTAAACSPTADGPGQELLDGDGGVVVNDAGMPVVVRCSPADDADGDGIADMAETETDDDRDGIPNHLDEDSDGDGLSDAVEHGSADACGFADSDGDGVADFRDLDSDEDGLSDARELELGTNTTMIDSDGDGVSDFAEVEGTNTDPTDKASTIPETDFFVVLPHQGPQEDRRLDFGTDLKKADVYFLIDSTGSMEDSISDVRTKVASTMEKANMQVEDIQFGVGFYRDGGAYVYRNKQTITGDLNALKAALNEPAAGGGDEPEDALGAIEEMYKPNAECPAGRHAQPCFRPGALPIIVLITDASMHARSSTFAKALETLNANHAKLIGISVSSRSFSNLGTLVNGTNTVRADGSPILFSSSAANVSTEVANGIDAVAGQSKFDISTTAENIAGNPGDVDASQFIVGGVPVEGYRDGVAGKGYDSKDTTHFRGVLSGGRVEFDLLFQNTFHNPPLPEIHRAKIKVWGDDVTNLDERIVYILVPSGEQIPVLQ